MRSVFRTTIIFVGAMCLQWWWNTHLAYWGAGPQFLLVLTVLVAARRGTVTAMLAGFVWGLYLDVARAELFGASALTLTLIAYGVGVVRRQVDLRAAGPLATMTFIITWAAFLCHGLIGLIFKKSFEWSGPVVIIATPFLNAGAIAVASLLWEIGGER
ncbi:MAG: rod shape-determining protein MreD [Elusimicrobiota bacterium]